MENKVLEFEASRIDIAVNYNSVVRIHEAVKFELKTNLCFHKVIIKVTDIVGSTFDYGVKEGEVLTVIRDCHLVVYSTDDSWKDQEINK